MRRELILDKRIKKVTDLVESPIVIRVSKFTEDSAKVFSEEMEKAHNSGQPIIPIVIDSFGGQVYSLLDMIAQIQQASLPIATIIESKAMSCGSVLFSFGNQGLRFMAPHATMMIHDVSLAAFGKIEEVKSSTKEGDRLQKKIFSLMAQNCNKPNDYFLKMIEKNKNADWFLTAADCKKHQLCSKIGIPTYTTTVSVNYTFK